MGVDAAVETDEDAVASSRRPFVPVESVHSDSKTATTTGPTPISTGDRSSVAPMVELPIEEPQKRRDREVGRRFSCFDWRNFL